MVMIRSSAGIKFDKAFKNVVFPDPVGMNVQQNTYLPGRCRRLAIDLHLPGPGGCFPVDIPDAVIGLVRPDGLHLKWITDQGTACQDLAA